ncbi:MAG TPA: AAA family ATPase [Solirubrobacterales bacterium]|nr:AAA family ATPase [Solirubrobacterales bacterium]
MEARNASERIVPLLERETELVQLEGILDIAERGRGGVALVEGAAGLGKSSLLAHARRAAIARGFLDLHATGDELERSFSFGVVHQLFAEPVRREAERDDDLVSGAAELAMPLLDGATPLPSDRVPAFRLLHGLHWLTAGLAERSPLLLCVDDAHWADASSLRFLLYLARRVESLPVAILVAIRSGEPLEPAAEEALTRLSGLPGAASVSPGSLGEGSVTRLVNEQLPGADPGLGAVFREATGGNPFLLLELLAAARADGAIEPGEVGRLHSESIRSSIVVRLRGIGPDAARLASAVAVLGPAGSAHLVRKLSQLDADSAAAAADALVAAQILAPGEPHSFAHPIVREVVYADLPEASRRREHALAASLLRDEGGSATEIASHVLRGERIEEKWVAGVLREAAEDALQRDDGATAARIMRRALEESDDRDDPDLLLVLARAELVAREPTATGRLETARAAAREPVQQARAAAALAHARMLLGDSPRTFEAIRDALERIPPGTGGEAEAELFVWALFTGRLVSTLVDETTAMLSVPRLSSAGNNPPAAEVARRGLSAFDSVFRGDLDAATADFEWALANAGEQLGHLPITARSMLGACAWRLGRYDTAQAILDPALAESTRRGDLFEIGSCLEGRIGLAWARGDVNACLADVETMTGLDDEGWETATSAMYPLAAEMLLEREEPKAAQAMMATVERIERRLPGSLGWFWVPYGRAFLAMRHGEWNTALEQALTAGKRLLELQIPSPDYFPWRSIAARAAGRLEDHDRARSLAEEELDLARAAGSPKATGIALATLGSLRGGEEGVALLSEAVELLDDTEAELAPTRARLELGMALRRARRPRDARKPLEEALDSARRLGSVHVTERALGELHAAGGRPRRLALSGVESLTPGQLRVARMAAEGMSNREIAEALFVTRRTVETHLTQAYGKLEIGSREELPEALGRVG